MTTTDIERRIATYVADVVRLSVDAIDLDQDLENYGMSSSVIIAMVGDLEEWLNMEISPAVLFEYATIRAISSHLHGQLSTAKVARVASK